ncbi:MAG: SDR family NAD(P)-dependent oxidoreductase [Rhodospirillales bacterium]|nr:MAG: SDR family NAD(P)-dependent oxidoreductase [Rhodospirillales bacterium]
MGEASQEKVAWITGAGKGIGRALARRLAHDGWNVAASARSEEDLGSLVEECPPGRVRSYPLDITDLAATETVLGRIEENMGRIDLAVLNAGTHTPVNAVGFSVETVRHLVETNLMGTATSLSCIMPKFLAHGEGHIAVVGSLAGYRGLPTAAAYGASKAGVINMCEALKPELELHGVRLTLINPGFVETPLTDKNDFPMPFLMPVEEAVEQIMRGLRRTAFEVTFPWRFAILMKLLRLLPDRLFFAVTRRMVRR